MITKDQLLEATIAWAKAELAADDCGSVVRALYRATHGQPRPLPEEEQKAIDEARGELTTASNAGDAAFEQLRQISREFIEQDDERPKGDPEALQRAAGWIPLP